MHTMLWSHQALRGSMGSRVSMLNGLYSTFLKCIHKKAPLWVDHTMHTMLWSHKALRGSVGSRVSTLNIQANVKILKVDSFYNDFGSV